MHTKSIRVPEEMLAGIELVEVHEHIEEAASFWLRPRVRLRFNSGP